MKRVRIVVAYDGTHYHGWQIQPGKVTIESKLNEALTSLLGEPVQVIGASRTDSGVHARGNVAVFDTSHRMPADRICMALNQRLPEDIRVQSSEEVASDWHPRKCRCLKTYEYRILNRRIEMPMQRFYSHFCYFNLDLDKMRQAAGLLTGEHDFKSFCSVHTQVTDTVRTIYSLDIRRDDDLIGFSVCCRLEGFQTLKLQYSLVCSGFFYITDTIGSCSLYSADRFCLAFCLFDPFLLLSLCAEDRGLLISLSVQNHRLFLTFCHQNGGFLLTFCL